jgi:hypothetical protein
VDLCTEAVASLDPQNPQVNASVAAHMQSLPDLTAAVRFEVVEGGSKEALTATWKAWMEEASEQLPRAFLRHGCRASSARARGRLGRSAGCDSLKCVGDARKWKRVVLPAGRACGLRRGDLWRSRAWDGFAAMMRLTDSPTTPRQSS